MARSEELPQTRPFEFRYNGVTPTLFHKYTTPLPLHMPQLPVRDISLTLLSENKIGDVNTPLDLWQFINHPPLRNEPKAMPILLLPGSNVDAIQTDMSLCAPLARSITDTARTIPHYVDFKPLWIVMDPPPHMPPEDYQTMISTVLADLIIPQTRGVMLMSNAQEASLPHGYLRPYNKLLAVAHDPRLFASSDTWEAEVPKLALQIGDRRRIENRTSNPYLFFPRVRTVERQGDRRKS